jgi:GWxTD domain-containing protein
LNYIQNSELIIQNYRNFFWINGFFSSMKNILLKMKRKTCLTGSIVLCQLFLYGFALHAQTIDSSKILVFNAVKNPIEVKPRESRLDGIASIGFGTYGGYRSDGYYGSFLQPNLGVEFLAEPAGAFHLLLGGHIGISNPITVGVSFGLREPLNISQNPDIKVFTDIGILFFNDSSFLNSVRYGARIAFGARTSGSLNFEYRLAGEWRGSSSRSIEGDRIRQLWWVGAEVGIAFSLVKDIKPILRKDSIRAALHYIATEDELDELDAVFSDAKLDIWLDRFWRIRDQTPDTKLNEARIEYERRVDAANRIFSHRRHLGILTDPGRVMAIYGTPNIQDKDHATDDDQVQYIVFIYSGRVRDVSFATFIFESSHTELDWKQIYLNVPGELTGSVPQDLPPRMWKWIQ